MNVAELGRRMLLPADVVAKAGEIERRARNRLGGPLLEALPVAALALACEIKTHPLPFAELVRTAGLGNPRRAKKAVGMVRTTLGLESSLSLSDLAVRMGLLPRLPTALVACEMLGDDPAAAKPVRLAAALWMGVLCDGGSVRGVKKRMADAVGVSVPQLSGEIARALEAVSVEDLRGKVAPGGAGGDTQEDGDEDGSEMGRSDDRLSDAGDDDQDPAAFRLSTRWRLLEAAR